MMTPEEFRKALDENSSPVVEYVMVGVSTAVKIYEEVTADLRSEIGMWRQVWDGIHEHEPGLREDNKPLAVAAWALLRLRERDEARKELSKTQEVLKVTSDVWRLLDEANKKLSCERDEMREDLVAGGHLLYEAREELSKLKSAVNSVMHCRDGAGCDSYVHEEGCPAAGGANALVHLAEELRKAQEMLALACEERAAAIDSRVRLASELAIANRALDGAEDDQARIAELEKALAEAWNTAHAYRDGMDQVSEELGEKVGECAWHHNEWLRVHEVNEALEARLKVAGELVEHLRWALIAVRHYAPVQSGHGHIHGDPAGACDSECAEEYELAKEFHEAHKALSAWDDGKVEPSSLPKPIDVERWNADVVERMQERLRLAEKLAQALCAERAERDRMLAMEYRGHLGEEDCLGEATLTALEAFRAAGKVEEPDVTCSECHGTGRTDNHVTGEVECGSCKGAGIDTPECGPCDYGVVGPCVHPKGVAVDVEKLQKENQKLFEGLQATAIENLQQMERLRLAEALATSIEVAKPALSPAACMVIFPHLDAFLASGKGEPKPGANIDLDRYVWFRGAADADLLRWIYSSEGRKALGVEEPDPGPYQVRVEAAERPYETVGDAVRAELEQEYAPKLTAAEKLAEAGEKMLIIVRKHLMSNRIDEFEEALAAFWALRKRRADAGTCDITDLDGYGCDAVMPCKLHPKPAGGDGR